MRGDACGVGVVEGGEVSKGEKEGREEQNVEDAKCCAKKHKCADRSNSQYKEGNKELGGICQDLTRPLGAILNAVVEQWGGTFLEGVVRAVGGRAHSKPNNCKTTSQMATGMN